MTNIYIPTHTHHFSIKINKFDHFNSNNYIPTSLQRGSMQARDHLVKLKAVAQSNTVTCEQVKDIVEITRTIPVEVIVLMYPAISDKEEFDKLLTDALQWQDQRDEIKKQLGL